MILPKDSSPNMYLAALAPWKITCETSVPTCQALPVSFSQPPSPSGICLSWFSVACSVYRAGPPAWLSQEASPNPRIKLPVCLLLAFTASILTSSCSDRTSPGEILSFCVYFPVIYTSRFVLHFSHLCTFSTSYCPHSNLSAASL